MYSVNKSFVNKLGNVDTFHATITFDVENDTCITK